MVTKSLLSYPSQGALIDSPRVLDLKGRQVNLLARGERYVYTYDVSFHSLCFRVQFGMMIKSLLGVDLGGHSTGREDRLLPTVEAGNRMTARFEFECHLLPGIYFMNAGVSGAVGEEWGFLHRIIDAYMFRVQEEVDLHRSGFVDFGIVAHVRDSTPASL